jgi:peptidyl-prolyl cis-trans isomerase C
VRARYDKEVAATAPENEVRARHILLETEEEAKAVIAELDGGADFEALAKEKSTGPTGPNGGDLGYFTRGRMVPEFEEAAYALDVGGYTKQPVQTQFGWHVIKLEDKRQVQPPAFADVEGQIPFRLHARALFRTPQQLREEAEVEISDPALKEAYEKAMSAQQPPAAVNLSGGNMSGAFLTARAENPGPTCRQSPASASPPPRPASSTRTAST